MDDAADEDTNCKLSVDKIFFKKKCLVSEDIGAIKKQYGFANQSTLDDFFGPEGDERAPTDFRNLDAMRLEPFMIYVVFVQFWTNSTKSNPSYRIRPFHNTGSFYFWSFAKKSFFEIFEMEYFRNY